jgi:ADP-heptose:LPS heptosyltransferase
MPNLYNLLLNHKFSNPLSDRLLVFGLKGRSIYFFIKSSIGFLFFREKRHFKINKKDISKILIIKTERVGDIVLSTPALRALRKEYPETQIDYLLPGRYAPLLNCYTGWDNIIGIDDTHNKAEFKKTASKLRSTNYDVVIIQHRAPNAYKLGKLSGAKIRIGWNAKGCGYLLTHPLKDDQSTTLRHQVENNLRLLEPLGVYEQNPTFPLQLTQHGKQQVETFFKNNNISPEKPIVIIHPASFSPRKQWAPDRFAQVADYCCNNDIQTIIIGNGADKSVVEKVFTFTKIKPLNAFNAFDLEGIVSLLKTSTIFVGNSTGPMHIAASTGIWTIALFGDRYKLDRLELWRPYSSRGVVVMTDCAKDPCLPWTCKEMVCFNTITPEMVWTKIKHILQSDYKKIFI